MDDVDEVVALEFELLDPACRGDSGRVAELLDSDFVEIGRSGRVWHRDDTIAALAGSADLDGTTIGPMVGRLIADGMVVVRYTTHHRGGPATVHRSSWWRRTPDGWRCWFHQATVAPDPTAEAAAVANSERPTTRVDVEAAFHAVGLSPGSIVIVHCSLSRLGWVLGDAVTVLDALRSVVGPEGTIVMPAQTGFSDPAHWQNPPVPEAWWPAIREQWPAFDPTLTPTRRMGKVAECFARLAGAVHSGHPTVGFVAHGPRAVELMCPHPLDDGFGEGSPLARLHAAGADIVLLGVGHDNNTSLHLAEVRALGDGAPTTTDGAALLVDGRREWVEYSHVDHDESDFVRLGDAYATSGGTEVRAQLGAGDVCRVPMRELIDFATTWIATERRQQRGPGGA